jgi:hypothetical protein
MNPLNRPGLLLRFEGLIALAAGCAAYQRFYPGHWGLFALLFLAPDISLLGYLVSSNRLSTSLYNVFHSYLLPVLLAPFAGQIALIWLCHISFDRLLGYGLKYPGVFRHTHIQAAEDDQSREKTPLSPVLSTSLSATQIPVR